MYYYKEVKKPNRIIGKLFLSLCRKYLNYKVNIKVEKNDTKKLTPPYLVLGNHVTYWDPFLVNMFLDEPMCYIAAAIYFRNPILRFFLNSAGSIPKKKFMTHVSPVKRLIRAKKNGRILGIFPEGERKWDGTTDEMAFHSTAKLIKKLNVPVITVNIKGGYLAYPRWARMSRKGQVNLSYQLCLNKEDVEKMPISEIDKRVREKLEHDEVAYQRKTCNSYIGKNLAENLEHLLFICPQCKSFNTLVSKNDQLVCQHCQYGVCYNQYGFLEAIQKKLYFDNLRDWNRWQNSFLRKLIQKKIKNSNAKIILEDHPVDILKGSFEASFQKQGEGRLWLDKMGLHYSLPGGEKHQFNVKHITGLNVQFHAVLEFNYKEHIYRLHFHNPHVSAYKWVQAIHYIQEENQQSKKINLISQVN
jgi:1-acyl-sn-glycerol-3-phosphate acyltransferase